MASKTNLRQGTLSFASSKRGAAATASGKANVLKQTPPIGFARPPATEKKAPGSRTVSTDSTASNNTISSTSVPSDDEALLLSTASTASAQRGAKRMKTASGAVRSTSARLRPRTPANESSSEDEPEPVTPKGILADLEKSGRLNKLYGEARAKNSHLPLIHAEKQTNVHHILRVFDNSYEYGPCVGMTRLQRWERASALGLNPPAEIREILLTEEAFKDNSFKESVFSEEA